MPELGNSGLYNTIINVSQSRAIKQANTNIETQSGVVRKTYTNNGAVYAADVQVYGETNTRISLPNNTGTMLTVGAVVTVNNLRGNSTGSTIVQLGSGGTSAAAQINASSTANAALNPIPQVPPNDGIPFILQSSDPIGAPSGFVEEPGANVYFDDVEPGNDISGGQSVNGTRTITAVPLVLYQLPDGNNYLDSTLVDLQDSYGISKGIYRWASKLNVWVRRDVQIELYPGANIYLSESNNEDTITAVPLVFVNSLPNPLSYLIGTCADVTDSYSNPLGMYRINNNQEWVRRDSYQLSFASSASTLGVNDSLVLNHFIDSNNNRICTTLAETSPGIFEPLTIGSVTLDTSGSNKIGVQLTSNTSTTFINYYTSTLNIVIQVSL